MGSPDKADAALIATLEPHADVVRASSLEQAFELARHGAYDLVVDASGDLLPSAGLSVTGAGRILRDIAQPVFIVDRDGALGWCNPRLKSYPSDVVEALRSAAAKCVNAMCSGSGSPRTRRERLRIDRDLAFELIISPLLGDTGTIERVVVLANDQSEAEQLQERLDAIDRAGRELVGIDVDLLSRMGVAERLEFLEERIINCCRDLLHFDHFAILLVDPQTRRLETLIASGLVEADGLNMYVGEEKNGICGRVAATGQSYICPDVSRDPYYLPGLEQACSSLTVPLSLHHQIVGVLNVESDRCDAFTEEDRQFAEIFGRYIALALHTLRLLAAERQTAAGQVVADVDAESAHPLNDIVTDVAKLIEDYRDNEALCARLRSILDDVDRVRDAIHAVTEGGPITGGRSGDLGDLLQGKRILVADDEDVIRDTISDVLVKHGAIASMARDGKEAIALLHVRTFDLVLSDIKMPHKNGYEVFAESRRMNEACPVILITGFGYDPEHSIVRA
ncbi:MAG: response regulator, partial [Planctomycetota bacterium]